MSANEYEARRQAQIAANNARLAAFGVPQAAAKLAQRPASLLGTTATIVLRRNPVASSHFTRRHCSRQL